MAKRSSPAAKRPRHIISAIVALIVLGLAAIAAIVVYQVRASAGAAAANTGFTLDPNLFEGQTGRAYRVAQQHPELLAQLHCYCGCEQHEGHKNLLDCFRTDHGAACDTCVGEAAEAGQLAKEGMPTEQIRKVLQDRFAHGS